MPSVSRYLYAFLVRAHPVYVADVQTFDGAELIELIKKLVMTDKDWIPQEKGYSLYIRKSATSQYRPVRLKVTGPTLIATQNALGVGPSSDALLFVICCPVGPYYASKSSEDGS